eukprot:7731406-Lingulodinium_polyedra.AAC.1
MAFTEEAEKEYERGPWRANTPTEAVFTYTGEAGQARGGLRRPQPGEGRARILGRLMKGIQALRATRLWRCMDEGQQTALLQSAGPGVGQ